MKKDTRFSIRKLTVGVASIAVASFLTSGTVDAANLSILNSHIDDDVYNPELPFEPFPPSISYTQPEAPWMQGSVETEVPGDDVEEVTEPGEANYENPEAPFAPGADANYENPEAPFAPGVDANYENPEAPFAPAPVFTEAEAPFAGREVEVEDEPEFTEAEAPFAGREVEVEEDPVFTEAEAPFAGREVEVEDEPEFTEAEAPFAGREVEVEEDDDEVTEPLPSNGVNPEAPFAPVEEEEEEDLEFEILPGYKVEEAIGADGKKYKRLVPIEDEEVEEDTPDVEEETPDVEELEVLPGYKVEKVKGADGKFYEVLVPIEEEAEEPGVELTELAPAEELDTKIVFPAPSQEAKEAVTNSSADLLAEAQKKGANLEDVQLLLNSGLNAYKLVTGNEEATLTDALAAGLEYYRVVSKNESATLEDVIAELNAIAEVKGFEYAYSLQGARELDAKYSDSNSPIENYKKAMGVELPVYTDDELAQVKEMAENGNENAKKILGLLGL